MTSTVTVTVTDGKPTREGYELRYSSARVDHTSALTARGVVALWRAEINYSWKIADANSDEKDSSTKDTLESDSLDKLAFLLRNRGVNYFYVDVG